MKTAPIIVLSDDERRTLTTWPRGRSTPARLVLRAKIILAAAEGKTNETIAADLHTSKPTVGRWRSRFAARRTAGIAKDASRPGRTPAISAETVTRIVQKTTQEKPENATHWSTRSMAKVIGVGKDTVRRVWAANGLKPHLTRTFKLGNDPRFEEKRTLWGCISIRRNMHWCSAPMKRPRSRRWIGHNAGCRFIAAAQAR